VSDEAGEFRHQNARLEELIQALENLPDTAAREAARELTRSLLQFHAIGLRQMLNLIDQELVLDLSQNPVVCGLLLLHNLHPLPAEGRVIQALDRVRHHFHAVGGDVELLSANEEVVRLRLRGNQTVDQTLRALAHEVVIEAVPDVSVVEFEEAWDRDPSGRVALRLIV
jgi:hypothetical protein